MNDPTYVFIDENGYIRALSDKESAEELSITKGAIQTELLNYGGYLKLSDGRIVVANINTNEITVGSNINFGTITKLNELPGNMQRLLINLGMKLDAN